MGTRATNSAAAQPALGRRLAALRKAAGWTLRELAARSDISRQAILDLEHGAKVPSVDTVAALAAALGVPPGELAWPEKS